MVVAGVPDTTIEKANLPNGKTHSGLAK